MAMGRTEAQLLNASRHVRVDDFGDACSATAAGIHVDPVAVSSAGTNTQTPFAVVMGRHCVRVRRSRMDVVSQVVSMRVDNVRVGIDCV